MRNKQIKKTKAAKKKGGTASNGVLSSPKKKEPQRWREYRNVQPRFNAIDRKTQSARKREREREKREEAALLNEHRTCE